MFRRTVLWIVTGLLVGIQPALAYELPAISKGDLRFHIDLASFRGPIGKSRLEVSLLIDARQLTFVDRKKGQVGELALVAAALDSSGERAASRTWVQSVSVEGLEVGGEMGAPFRDIVRFDLRPGPYRILLHLKDVHGVGEGRCEVDFEVRDFDGSGLVFSDLQFASTVERSSLKHRFVKQGWNVVPNTSRFFASGKSLGVYFELYNLSNRTGDRESFILGYSLIDEAGNKVMSFPARRYIKPGESVVKAELLNTEGLAEGSYEVQVEAFDGHSREYLRTSRKFYLFSSKMPEGLGQLQKDLLRYYMDIRYVADEKSKDTYHELEDWPSRMVFLRSFWQSMDPSPSTDVNERLVEHVLRMSQADRRFYPGRGRQGSDTDRGRIFVRLGPPDDVDYHTFAAGQRSYEVWIYEQQGRHEFVFRDRTGDGVYDLVHSTYPGEIFNPYWSQEF